MVNNVNFFSKLGCWMLMNALDCQILLLNGSFSIIRAAKVPSRIVGNQPWYNKNRNKNCCSKLLQLVENEHIFSVLVEVVQAAELAEHQHQI